MFRVHCASAGEDIRALGCGVAFRDDFVRQILGNAVRIGGKVHGDLPSRPDSKQGLSFPQRLREYLYYLAPGECVDAGIDSQSSTGLVHRGF